MPRRSLFVGRDDLVNEIRDAARGSERVVIWIHGVGGSGKSTILDAVAAQLRADDVPNVLFPAMDVPPLAPALRQVLGSAPEGAVWLVDEAERWTGVESVFIEELGARARVAVVASRRAPGRQSTRLITQGVALRVVALPDLTRADALEYLARRGLSEANANGIVARVGGHALGLALAADAQLLRGSAQLDLAASPEILHELAAAFLDGTPDEELRNALAVFIVLRVTTEEHLRAFLGDGAARAYERLRGLSFARLGPTGLLAHPLARDALRAELRYRDPATFRALVAKVVHYFGARIARSRGLAVADFAQITDVISKLETFEDVAVPPDVSASLDAFRPDDLDLACVMTMANEGPTSAGLVRTWYALQPEAFVAVRDPAGSLIGFGNNLRLDAAPRAALEADALSRAAWDFVESAGGAAGPSVIVRHLMLRDGYQTHTPEMNLVMSISGQPLFQLPDIAFAFLAQNARTAWSSLLPAGGARPVPGVALDIDGETYSLSFHDRRGVTVAQWLDALVHRALLRDEGLAPDVGAPIPGLLPALRDALERLTTPARLGDSPLCALSAVQVRARVEPIGHALAAHLIAEIDRVEPERARRALRLLYVDAAGITREDAADRLGVGVSSLRRHVTEGVDALAKLIGRG